ncbi:hypothetical protein Gohar_006635, partial [Gossypium harknessii]|nr:hypothetical protein [Gossypium harknessii]
MVVDLVVEPTISWKDKLVSKGPGGLRGEIEALGAKLVEEFYFQEGDITSSIVNGIPLVVFLERVYHFFIKDMANIVLIKLFGRTTGFAALQNKIYNMWKPSMPIKMMDTENVQPWSLEFNPAQPFSSDVMAWIRFLGYMYKQKVLWEIREMVVKVTKLDFNPNNGARGRFARMAIYVNLDKLFVPQVLINGNIHKVEYKHLPWIYFSCKRYGYRKGVCTNTVPGPMTNMAVVESGGADDFVDSRVKKKGTLERGKHSGVKTVSTAARVRS